MNDATTMQTVLPRYIIIVVVNLIVGNAILQNFARKSLLNSELHPDQDNLLLAATLSIAFSAVATLLLALSFAGLKRLIARWWSPAFFSFVLSVGTPAIAAPIWFVMPHAAAQQDMVGGALVFGAVIGMIMLTPIGFTLWGPMFAANLVMFTLLRKKLKIAASEQ